MQSRFVPTTTLLETLADSKMDGAAELFVEEHILTETLDTVICSNAPFAKDACARVGIEKRREQLLTFCCFLLDYFAIFKPELDIRYFLTTMDGRVFETDPAIDRISHIAQHIPMQSRFVPTTTLLETLA